MRRRVIVTSKLVAKYIKKRTEEGRLVLEEIKGGLTSVMQVCDLTVNREIKSLIKKGYLAYIPQGVNSS